MDPDSHPYDESSTDMSELYATVEVDAENLCEAAEDLKRASERTARAFKKTNQVASQSKFQFVLATFGALYAQLRLKWALDRYNRTPIHGRVYGPRSGEVGEFEIDWQADRVTDE